MAMTAAEKASFAIGMEKHLRDALHSATVFVTDDPTEQADIATATVTLLVRRLYQSRGQVYLEAIIKAVLE